MTFRKARHRSERSATRGPIFGDAFARRVGQARIAELLGVVAAVTAVGLIVGVLVGGQNVAGPLTPAALPQQTATVRPDARPVPFPIHPAIPYPRRDAPQAPAPVAPVLESTTGPTPAPAPSPSPSPSGSTSAPGKSATAPGHVKKPPKP